MNCIIMAIERPGIDPNSTERKVIDISNHIFTVVFTIEMCIKVSHSCVAILLYTLHNFIINRIPYFKHTSYRVHDLLLYKL